MSDLLMRLAADDTEQRNEAIGEAAGVDDPDVARALLGLASSPDVGTPARTAAAAALARMPGEHGIGLLGEVLANGFDRQAPDRGENPQLRGLAASALEHRPGTDSVMLLLQSLTDPVNNVRNLAERSLLSMTCQFDESAHERLGELLGHPVPLTRSPAARLVGAAELTIFAGRLAEMAAGDEDWLPRMWALRALGDLGQAEQLEVLEGVARGDEKNRVRAAAVEAIGAVRAERSEAVLQDVLEHDDDDGVKRAAEEALEELHRGGFDD